MRPIIRNLSTRLILSFLGLSLVTVLIVAYISYDRARASLSRAVYDRLTATLELKEDGLNNWIEERIDDVLFVQSIPDIRRSFLEILSDTSGARSPAYLRVYDFFNNMLINHPDFAEIFLLSRRGGEVMISSNLGNEGDYRVSDTYFIEGLKGPYLQDIYLSPVNFRPTITIAVPVRDENLTAVGVLAAHLDLMRMDRIVFQASGLGKTGESYLVDSTNAFVAGRGFGRTDYPRGAHSLGISRALEGRSGTGLYRNYAGVGVVGAYRWIPERRLALIAEVSQSEAFYPARRLAAQILILGLAVSLFLALATRVLAYRITRPILAVKDAADRISRGDCETRAPVRTADEVGDLAKAFNSMVDEIQEGEERFRTIFDTIPDVVNVFRLSDYTYVDVNREFEEASGYTFEEVVGKTTLDVGVWADVGDRDRFYEVIEKEGRVRNLEINLVLKDGTLRTGLVSADLITLSGEPHLLAITRDITKLKEAQRAARENEELFRATFEQAAVGIAHVGLDGRWLRVNDRLCEILGYSGEELAGKSVKDVTHPEDREKSVHLVNRKILEEKGSFTMEKRYIKKDGSVVWVIITAALLRREDGSPRHLIGIVQDITDRKVAERALKESEERYRILFNAGSDAIFVFSIDDRGLPGKLYTVNEVACRVLRKSYNELTELTLMDIGQGMQDPEEARMLISTILEGKQYTFEQTLVSSDGKEIPVEINACLFDFYETPIIFAVARDLTDRKKAEEEQKKIHAKLIQANKMTSLGLLVSSLAHEINNPNNTIMFNMSRFARTWEDTLPILERHHRDRGDFELGGVSFTDLKKILPRLMTGTLESSQMIKVIIDNLKGYARQSSEDMDLDVDVNGVVKSSVALLDTQLMTGIGRLELDLQEDLPIIKGNPQKLVQVTVNLISNALEALTADDQTVVVSTSSAGDGSVVVLTVADNGSGMTEKQKSSVFEPFFSTKLEKGGTGLGLTITKMLLDEHGASIDISSVPGEGTEVTVTLGSEEKGAFH